MKRVIITGATGFVGANLARRLVHDGHMVHLLVRSNYQPWRIEALQPDVYLYQVELENLEVLIQVISQIQPDWVFHLAAYGAYSWQTDLQRMVQTNVIGTINLIETCRRTGFEAFVNTGSSSEYGFKDHAPSEREWLEPNSYYAVAKASATLFCRYTGQKYNLHIPTLRLYSAYGPYEDPGRLIPSLILHGLRGELPPLVNPEVARDYVYIEDVIQAYLLAATTPSQEPGAVYNVGTGLQTPLREVVEVAQWVMDITVEPKWGSMPDRNWDTDVWLSDNHKICDELNWQPNYTFEQGFRATLNWFLNNPRLYQFYDQRQQKIK